MGTTILHTYMYYAFLTICVSSPAPLTPAVHSQLCHSSLLSPSIFLFLILFFSSFSLCLYFFISLFLSTSLSISIPSFSTLSYSIYIIPLDFLIPFFCWRIIPPILFFSNCFLSNAFSRLSLSLYTLLPFSSWPFLERNSILLLKAIFSRPQ